MRFLMQFFVAIFTAKSYLEKHNTKKESDMKLVIKLEI